VNAETPIKGFDFDKRGQLFIRTDNDFSSARTTTLSVVAVRVSNAAHAAVKRTCLRTMKSS